jgi:hypothetical protein
LYSLLQKAHGFLSLKIGDFEKPNTQANRHYSNPAPQRKETKKPPKIKQFNRQVISQPGEQLLCDENFPSAQPINTKHSI